MTQNLKITAAATAIWEFHLHIPEMRRVELTNGLAEKKGEIFSV